MLPRVRDNVLALPDPEAPHAPPEGARRKLLIAIPALNEEDAIESIIQRALAARQAIIQTSPVTDVDVTVVSDGSTDRTADIARRYSDQVGLIVFPANRGYGAAIKEAWRRSDAEWLGFLDADGTCDPLFFAELCRTADSHDADVVLGCRLNSASRMPLLRRVGNVLFALVLNLVSSKRVRDTASGMRVVRRSSLGRLYPLPDGLHFTPAMSARAILSRQVRIVEVDMPYEERTGESKLRVVKDGVRFLRVILETAFLYRPSRLLDLLAWGLFAAAGLLMLGPTGYYIRHRAVAEWMIYRFIVSQLLATAGCLLLSVGYLTGRMVGITLAEEAYEQRVTLRRRLFRGPWFWLPLAALVVSSGALVFEGFLQLVTSGNVYEHWSRFVVMSFLLSAGMIIGATRAADYVLSLVAARVRYLKEAAADAQRGVRAAAGGDGR